jgi:hypothetical protein
LNTWEYYNPHKNDHGISYQVVMSLGKPFKIVSFEGPFKGCAADVSIFRSTLKPRLIEGEMVMTDKGYWQDDRCWHPPTGKYSSFTNELKIQRRCVTVIRHLNERGIGRLTFWGIFKRRWASSFERHKLAASVVSRLCNLELHAFPLT